MRKLTFIKSPIDNILKIMLHENGEGVYLYLYDCVQEAKQILAALQVDKPSIDKIV